MVSACSSKTLTKTLLYANEAQKVSELQVNKSPKSSATPLVSIHISILHAWVLWVNFMSASLSIFYPWNQFCNQV